MKAKLTKAGTSPTLDVEGEWGKVRIYISELSWSETMLVTVRRLDGNVAIDEYGFDLTEGGNE